MSRVLDRLAAQYDIDRFVRHHGRDPYRVLIGCILSLRTKDEVTYAASARLFARAATPEGMVLVPAEEIARRIYPAGFYRRKSEQIVAISRKLLDEHGGTVPDDIDALLTLPGVGRKTANLVVTLGYGSPGICVDIHVHRICNRLGWVRTEHPDDTERVLRRILPRRHWTPINETLVRHGQETCHPTSPWCTRCTVRSYCPRNGVIRSR